MKVMKVKTILLVEDNAVIALSEKKTLVKNGFDVIVAMTGEKAIQAIREHEEIGLVLMDIDLGPGMDGTEAAEKILQERDLPVVFLSSHTEPEVVEKTETITSYGYIVKNSGTTVLLASIKMALKLFEARASEKEKQQSLQVANSELRETRRILEQTAGLARVGGWETDVVTGEVEWSPLKLEIHGFPPDHRPVMEDTINCYREGQDRETIRHLVSRAMETGESYDVELRIITGTGEERWVRTMGTAEFQDGRCVRLYGMTQDIDEYKRVEEELRRSREMLRTVIDNIPHHVFWKNRDSVYLGCNDLGARVAGVENPEAIVGKTDHDLPWTREQADFFRACDRRVMDTGIAEYHIIEPQRQSDGRESWLDTNKIPIRDEEGNVTGVLVTFEDITDRLALQDALQIQTEELHRFFSLTPDLMCVADPNGPFLHVNGRWEAVLGYDAEYLQGTGFLDLVHPDDRSGTRKAIGAPDDGQHVLQFTNRCRCKDGQWRHIEWRAVYHGSIVYASARDVTEHRLFEGLVSSLIDCVPDLVFWKDPAGVYLGCNTEFARHLGRPRQEILGRTDYDIYPQEEADFFREKDMAVLTTLQPRANEEWISYPDGKKILLDTLKTPVHGPGGELIGIIGIARNITVRKAAEDELHRQLREKEIILRETHHRIKNNMASISGFLELQMRAAQNPDVSRSLRDAAGRVNSVREFYEKMLRAGGSQEARADLYIGDLADSVVALHEGYAGITVLKDLDPLVLRQKELFALGIIVNELITNSAKYAASGRPDSEVRIALKGRDGAVILVVQDNGPGLPAGFTPAGSNGFGAVLVGMLAEQLRGTARFESRGGTIVTVEFPAAFSGSNKNGYAPQARLAAAWSEGSRPERT